MWGMIQFIKARPSDAEKLAQASKRAFDDDIRYGAPGPGGPPGYDSAAWQTKTMRLGDYFKIVADDQIIGGIIVFRKGIREYNLGRIFIEPRRFGYAGGVPHTPPARPRRL